MNSILERLRDKHDDGEADRVEPLQHAQLVRGLRTTGKRFLLANLPKLQLDICQDLVTSSQGYPELNQKLDSIFKDVFTLKNAASGSNTEKVMRARLEIQDQDLPAMVRTSELCLYLDSD